MKEKHDQNGLDEWVILFVILLKNAMTFQYKWEIWVVNKTLEKGYFLRTLYKVGKGKFFNQKQCVMCVENGCKPSLSSLSQLLYRDVCQTEDTLKKSRNLAKSTVDKHQFV